MGKEIELGKWLLEVQKNQQISSTIFNPTIIVTKGLFCLLSARSLLQVLLQNGHREKSNHERDHLDALAGPGCHRLVFRTCSFGRFRIVFRANGVGTSLVEFSGETIGIGNLVTGLVGASDSLLVKEDWNPCTPRRPIVAVSNTLLASHLGGAIDGGCFLGNWDGILAKVLSAPHHIATIGEATAEFWKVPASAHSIRKDRRSTGLAIGLAAAQLPIGLFQRGSLANLFHGRTAIHRVFGDVSNHQGVMAANGSVPVANHGSETVGTGCHSSAHGNFLSDSTIVGNNSVCCCH